MGLGKEVSGFFLLLTVPFKRTFILLLPRDDHFASEMCLTNGPERGKILPLFTANIKAQSMVY